MKKKILVIDDNIDILGVCEYILDDMGFEVFTDTNCNDIIGKADFFKPDLILLDNWVPDNGGIAATKELKKNWGTQNIPVVLFSANSNVDSLARMAGADAFLGKPFDIDNFEHVVSGLLA